MKNVPLFLAILILPSVANAQNRVQPELFDVPDILSSWDDLTQGVSTKDDKEFREILKSITASESTK